ncbi:bacteriophage abortive infection AbiH family protein [Nitrosomonas ureae]|uniref:Bacteriophage abortive infection AbiH n=1 Tax=Nitrosomonas ureae TaxID=44577 RepID=A0A1H8ZZP6_9PROT|nr:bacteriophage abortive infection AbiH family protein [Nitrosomonas ureae]SEP69717.1 Bacteriophage abortive infection AbiH [Nitrosomonas ureae]SOD19330.1 Bacteriophage abortive infection AbiH [Nitrosomonas ureae]
MTRLYVIGNGFDLWHGLPTSYRQFYEFARDALDELANYYSFEVADVGPWCDFENSLGLFNWNEFFDAHNHVDVDSESFRPSQVYGLEDGLAEKGEHHVEAIRDCFGDWVMRIDVSNASQILKFKESDQFITFNYTSTLQSNYGIDDGRVLHIHGRAETSDELIFGHGEVMDEEPELDENGDSNRTMFSDAEVAAKYPFNALKKPVNDVLDRNIGFFRSLAHISEVVVIGHSLNKIDLPYFRKLAQVVPNAKWVVCCYDAEERKHHFEELVECGVLREFINVCTYSELESWLHHGRT